MNDYFFYCYSLPLEAGSIIKPGNWGRILKTYQVGSPANPWVLVRELVFEQVRREYYRDKPSRLESLFLCTTLDGIREFKNATNRQWDIIYRVQILDTSTPIHVSDWTLANFQNGDNFSALEARAAMYWKAEGVGKTELLTTSNVRVVEMIDTGL